MTAYSTSGLKPENEKRVVKARIKMLMNAPFFGTLAIRLKILKAGDWLPTAATDGKHLYFNENFLESLDDQELEFLICHEIMHCVYEHMMRRGSRDPALWNAAADFVINLEIVDQNLGKMPKVGLLDEKYRGLSSNEVYDLLYQEQKDKGEQGYKTMDVHMEPGQGDPQDGDGNGNTDPWKGPIGISKEEAKQLSDEIKQAVIEAAKQAGAGNIPGGVKRMLKELLEPEMDWRELLQMDIDSAFKSDFAWARPNRKISSMGGIVLPGLDTDSMVKVAVAIDTSGSISHDMLRDFLSEIKGIMDQHTDFEIKLWFFDTTTYTVHNFTPDNMDDMISVEIEGGGGTCFDCNFNMMKEIDLVPERLLIFTDGYPFGSWGDDSYCDTIFVIHGNGAQDAPFGQTVRYTRTKK